MMKKRILGLIMVFCMLITLAVPYTASAEDFGKCGSDANWTLNGDVLVINGSGRMWDNTHCYPWAGVKTLKVMGSVTYIGKTIFKDNKSLTTIEFGDSVTTIGIEAFRNCKNLKTVKFGNGLTEIGESAFFGCEKLENVVLPKNLKKIGRTSFMCSGVKSVAIPYGVTDIEVSAFQTCESLTSVEIPDTVTNLEYGAFSYCRAMTSVKIGNGISSIDDQTFAGCTSLNAIEFGPNLTYVYSEAFDETTGIKNVYYRGTKAQWDAFYSKDKMNIKNAKIHYNSTLPKTVAVTLNGKAINFDVKPQLVNGRTMVPIRAIFEAMGATVTWDGKTNTATCKKGSKTVKMTVGSKDLYVNGKVQKMDIAPVVTNGRTLAPARYVAEAFGAKVQWDDKTNTVIITSK